MRSPHGDFIKWRYSQSVKTKLRCVETVYEGEIARLDCKLSTLHGTVLRHVRVVHISNFDTFLKAPYAYELKCIETNMHVSQLQ